MHPWHFLLFMQNNILQRCVFIIVVLSKLSDFILEKKSKKYFNIIVKHQAPELFKRCIMLSSRLITIQWIAYCSLSRNIHWRAIFLVDGSIHPFNNWAQVHYLKLVLIHIAFIGRFQKISIPIPQMALRIF